jgi:hypothetical protein
MNELIPLSFDSFKTDEAVYDATVIDKLKRYWLTSYGMGQLFGAKNPRQFADYMRRRHPHLPKGSVGSVQTVDGKIRQTTIYTLLEAFEYASYATLPRAKEYVRRFPYIMLDIQSGKIKPMPHRQRRKLIALEGLKEIECVRYGERVEARQRVAESAGMSLKSTYRLEKLTPEHRYSRGWKALIIRKYLPLWLRIDELLSQGLQQKECARRLNISKGQVSMYVNYYSKKIGELLAYGA